jgi:putative membrane protein
VWDHHDGTGWWIVFGGIWVFLFLGIIIPLIIWGANRLLKEDRSDSDRPTTQNPLDIAKARYARGEISRDEFDQIKNDLSGH